MKPLIFAFPGDDARGETLASMCGAEAGRLNFRRFPDGESYFRLEPDVAARSVGFVCSLDHPDERLTALLMAAATARELGARRTGLVAPYLPYMRQDRRFRPGEPVSARLLGRMIGSAFNWLVTVDPHLHRIGRLSQAYPLSLGVVAAAPLLADWIGRRFPRPLIVGPDAESEQWVAGVAARLDAPYAIMRKLREGDEAVTIAAPDLSDHRDRTPVLVDDMVSSGSTLIEAVRRLAAQATPPAACVVVHALCEPQVEQTLRDLGAPLVSVDTVAHASNAISCDPLLISEAGQLL